MNLIDVFRTAVSNSFRSKLRTTLTVLAIFIGAFTLTLTSSIGTGVSSYLDDQVNSFGASDVLTVMPTMDATAQDDGLDPYDPEAAVSAGFPGFTSAALSAADIESIRNTAGLSDVQPVLMIQTDWIEFDGNGKFVVTVDASATLIRADLAAGNQLSDDDANEVLLPLSYVEGLGFASNDTAIGQTVTIGITDYMGESYEVDAVVVGVKNDSLIGNGVGVNQHLADSLAEIASTGRPDSIGESYTAASARFDADASESEINAIKDDLEAQGFTGQTLEDQLGVFQTVVSAIVGVLNAFAAIALVAASFGIVNTLLMSVQERTREIGLMKAMGMGSGRIFLLFSSEAVFIGFLGSVIGAGLAILSGTLISNALSSSALSELPGLNIMEFAPGSIATIVLIVMAIAFLAGTLPAYRASRQNPIDALRYE